MKISYWQQRQKQYDYFLVKTLRPLAREYKRATKDLLKEFEALLYEMGDEITLQNLYKYGRYDAMLTKLNMKLRELKEQSEKIIEPQLQNAYTDAYIASTINPTYTVNPVINEQAVEIAVNRPWVADGKIWKERLNYNQAVFTQKLSSGLVDIIATGTSPQKVMMRLKQDFGGAFYQVERLVRTELAHCQIQGELDRWKQEGVTHVEVISDQAEDWCLDYNHLLVPINETMEGENIPPFHPNCRCDILPVKDEG